MNEIYSLIIRYRFGTAFRCAVMATAVGLVFFHAVAIIYPLAGGIHEKYEILKDASQSLANITVAIILIFLLVQGQHSLRTSIKRQRREAYDQIGRQIVEWFQVLDSPIFAPEVVEPEPTKTRDALRNFKVVGHPDNLARQMREINGNEELIKQFCENVHFEITTYPSKIIYGLHLEFPDFETNEYILKVITDKICVSRQCSKFEVDHVVPKSAPWIFLIRTIRLNGDLDSDFSTVLTHARHFVEFVGHNYDIVYSTEILSSYIEFARRAA